MARWILAVGVLLAVASGCGGNEANRPGIATAPSRAGEIGGRAGALVNIGGGRSLFVHCLGSGSPALVLESGLGADTSQWQAVQPELARGSRVCAYDRVGVGNSHAPPGVRDAREEVADLRRLLARLRITPPYVLVGHSYGGVLARVFAHLHPNATAGLVLIDTMGRDGRRRQLSIWPRSHAPQIRERLATAAIDDVNLAVGEAIASRITTLGEIPLAVIHAARQDGLPRRPMRLRRALQRLWGRMHDEVARLSNNSVHVVALHSNHDVASARTGQPSVIVHSVRAVVRAARNGSRLASCARIFSGPDVRCRR